MSIKWIKIEDAVPRLVRKEKDYYEDNDGNKVDGYYSDPVLVLCKDGFIANAQMILDMADDLRGPYYFGPIDTRDEYYPVDHHGGVVAWVPLHDVYPDWFKDEELKEVKSMLIKAAGGDR